MSFPIKTAMPAGTETSFPGNAANKLAAAIRALGADERLREQVVTLCRTTERRLGLRNEDVRETITGPIIDALHAPGMPLYKAPDLHHPTEWLTTLPEWLRSEQAPA